MKTIWIGLVALLGGSAVVPPPSGGDWVQIWGDEFGPVPADCGSASVDCHKWNIHWQGRPKRTGSLTWMHGSAYAEVKGGALVPFFERLGTGRAGAGYITSHRLFGTTYGYFAARIKAPETRSGQAAFWLQPFAGDGTLAANNRVADSATDGAEIDILESKLQANAYSAGILCDNYRKWPNVCHDTRDNDLPAPGFRQGYHVYALNWTPTKLDFLYDGKVMHTVTDPDRIVHVAERVILSVGVLDQRMDQELAAKGGTDKDARVDWVRVYKDNCMDWGPGRFRIVNLATGEALTSVDKGHVAVRPLSKDDDRQLWGITRTGACGDRSYALRSQAMDRWLAADARAAAVLEPKVSAAGAWGVRFDSNAEGKDAYVITGVGEGGAGYLTAPTLSKSEAATLMPGRTDASLWRIEWVGL